MHTPTPIPTSAIPTSPAAPSRPSADDVGPSRTMEIGLHALVAGLLIVSIIGIAYVYGFNLQTGSALDNISAAVRALGVDGGFFLGLYFSRRLWMRRKQGWWDGLKSSVFGLLWFLVALLMAALSWFSNTLFVANFQTIITQDLLSRAGFASISPELVNKAIGAIPLVIVLLYSIVPRRVSTRLETRTPEEIEEEARREAARIRAQNLVAAARAEGAGQRLRTVVGGLFTEAFNLEEARQRDERRKQMRIALETAGYATADLSDAQVEIQAVARGVWDQATQTPSTVAAPPSAEDEGLHLRRIPRQSVTRPERLPIDALDQEEMEVWQPVERPGGKAAEIMPEPPPSWAEGQRAQTNTASLPPNRTDRAAQGDSPPLTRPTDQEAGYTLAELADALHVAQGTVLYWTRPDFTGATKIFAHEITTEPDGSKRVEGEVLLRLLRARKRTGGSPAQGFSPPLQGSLPAQSADRQNQGNHHIGATNGSKMTGG